MLRVFFTILSLVIIAVVAIQAGNRKEKDAITPIDFKIPKGFPPPAYNFSGNPLTQQGIELGRRLFYDGLLSKDGNFPCASCHQQFAAFVTYDHDFSHGFNNQFTTRNAPPLFNLAWQKEFMWDGGINNLEVQSLSPLTAPNEMAEDLKNVINKLKANGTYRTMFKAAFGTDEINSQRMLKALTQFMLTLVSADTKYDKMKRGELSFTADENTGYAIFKSKCASCHAEPLFTDLSYRNNGLYMHPTLKDYGRMRITNKKEDSLKFKVPSLRNIMITGPYMHDGRFSSLDQVFNHYSNEIVNSSTLDTSLTKKIPLSNADRVYLKIFFRTLTDSAFIKNAQFAQAQ